MERPSHMIFHAQSRNRLPLIGLAISLQAGALWLFMHAFVVQKFHVPPVLRFVPVLDRHTPPLPPPPIPHIRTHIDVPPVPPTHFDPPPQGPRNLFPPTPAEPTPLPPVSPVPDRGAIGIAATHVTPPYPPIARRIGAEGKVTLRLTVTAEGKVSEAEIMTSSGRNDLDQTAQAWIVAHWTYKPALAHGVPVASKTLASVTFSLINER
ncbi:MAG TPA: TonB family protein [Rhizomicrobium sp.]|nr:TonB family protein [Rhizomicrobium sp.]